jgi:hypothetical protein
MYSSVRTNFILYFSVALWTINAVGLLEFHLANV